MKRYLALFALLLLPMLAWGQGNTVTLSGSGAPAGGCAFIMRYIDVVGQMEYACTTSGTWFQVGPGAAGAVSLSSTTNLTGNKQFDSGAFTLVWNTSSNSGTANPFSVTDFATNTGTGYLFTVSSGSSSAIKPFRVCYRGTSNCVTFDTGTLSAIGTAGIDATTLLTKTWASPAAIGSGTPAAGTFAGLTGTGAVDFSGSTSVKVRVGAGLTTTANGSIGFDSTGNNYHAYNGADSLIGVLPASVTPADNDCVKWTVAAGKYTLNTAGAACGSGSGGVTSVAMTVPTGFGLTGSPITTTGTLALSMPSSWTTGDLLLGNGANSVARLAIGTNGQCLTSNGTTASWGSCAAGSIGGSGTANTISKFTASTTIGNSLLTDDTTTLAYGGTGGISATSDGVHAGTVGLIGNTTAPALTTNNFHWIGPNSATPTAYGLQVPTAEPSAAGLIAVGAASAHISAMSFYTLSGTGTVVALVTSPSFTTPTLGVASATSINKVAITAPASSATLTIADGKTATISNTLTFTGTDSSSVAFGAGGTVTYTIASGAKALATSSISANTCTAAQTDTATGTATTDAITFTPNADITGVTGYGSAGTLVIYAYPTANTVNFKVCNTDGTNAVTPGAVTLNWRVTR